MRPNPEPHYGVVPHYQPPPGAPLPAPEAAIGLSAGERQRLAGLSFDELFTTLCALRDECWRLRRTQRPHVVPGPTVLRLNGLLAAARRMTRGNREPVDVPALPEASLLSVFELVPPLERAIAALTIAAVHRPRPHAPDWRGWPRPFAERVAAAIAARADA